MRTLWFGPQFWFSIAFCERKKRRRRPGASRHTNLYITARLESYFSCPFYPRKVADKEADFTTSLCRCSKWREIRRIRMDGRRVGREGVSRRKYDIGFYVCNNASTPAVRIVHSETRMQPFLSSRVFSGIVSSNSAESARENLRRVLCASCTIFFIVQIYSPFSSFLLEGENRC